MRFRFTWLFITTIAALITGTGPAAAQAVQDGHQAVMAEMQKAQGHLAVWQRYPTVGIPLVATPPKIDGAVDTREWFAAARINRFVDETGLAVRDRCDVYLAYTPTHLYVAFQVVRPDNALLPTDRDWFELMIDPPHQGTHYLNVALDLGKVRWTGIGPNVDRKAWQPTVEYKARATDFGWEGELAIAFDQFPGLKTAPEPGTLWGIDFVRNERTPQERLATWAFRGPNYHKISNLGHLVFMGQAVAIRTESIGWIPQSRQAGVKLLVSNFTQAPVTFNAAAQVRKADKAVAMNYYPRIESAMAETLPAAISSPLVAEVEAALQDYPLLKEMNRPVTVEPNDTQLLQLAVADEPGKYLLGFALTQDKTLVAGGLLPIDIAVPLAIKLESYLISAHTMTYEVDLRRVEDKLTANSSLRISVNDPDGQTVAQDKRSAAKGTAKVAGELRLVPQFETTYQVVAELIEGEKSIAANTEPLRVPAKPVWLGNQLGLKKFVPEPFVPIQATTGECKTLAHTYTFTPGALLPGVRVFDQDILAAPLELSLKTAEGNALPIKVSSFAIQEKDDEQVIYTFAGELGQEQGAISGTIRIEFDGFVWYELKLTPRGSLSLGSASLQIALKPEYARYCTVGAGAGPNMPYSGSVPAEGLWTPFSYAYWLGGIEGGMQFMAESQRGWSNANPKEVARITADSQAGRLVINLVDKAVKVDKPLEWTFGLIPTPSRIKTKDWGKYAFFQSAGIVTPPHALPARLQQTKESDPKFHAKLLRDQRYFASPSWQRDKKNVYAFISHMWWQEFIGYPGTYKPDIQARLKDSVQWLHSEGLKCVIYAGWGVNNLAPEWPEYGTEMINLPLTNSGFNTYWQNPTTIWQDWFVYKIAQMIKEYDIDGIFIDSVTSLTLSENYTPGMRWIDESGNVRGSYPILATRQWLKRLYKLWHGELKEGGIIYNHQSPPAVMGIENFSDVRCPSEYAQTHDGAMDQRFVDFFVAKNAGEQYGLFVELTNKDWMSNWAKKKTNQIYALALPLNVSFKSVSLTSPPYPEHGSYALDQQSMPWVWAAKSWVEQSTAQYLPWWKNGQYLATSPADDQVLTALWLHEGQKALLCVSNLNDKPRRIEVTLNGSELGMMRMMAQDAITGETIPVDGTRLSVQVDFERYRLIKLTAVK